MKKLCIFFAVLLLVSCLFVPAFAETEMYSYNGRELPLFTDFDVNDTKWPYLLMFEAEDGIYIYKSQSIWKASSKDYCPQYTGQMQLYVLSEDESAWEFVGLYSYSAGKVVLKGSEGNVYIWSNFDVYDYSGSFFYEGDVNFLRPPLGPTLEEAKLEAVQILSKSLARSMGILAQTGVCCLASLVLLGIFGKRFAPFRKQ